VDAARLPESAIDDLKQAIEDFPGPAEVVLDLDTRGGTRRLRLGEAYRVQHTPALRAELEQALAPAPGTSAPAPSAPAPGAPAPGTSAPAPAAPAPAASAAG
jgi:hypothetical protein